ncbi:MAG TPA: diphosphomevalonate decarboxylase [Chromatiales bacterium]|nr:diphosphomevalonate decarboxylase [Chromatiales bacterium]
MSSVHATAVAHPNVALIKYWGKRDSALNLPAVDSLSITLGALQTTTRVSFDAGLDSDRLLLNGREQPAEQPRLIACLDALRNLAGTHLHAQVESVNDFPTAAGLASSASGYAALVFAGAAALGLDTSDPKLADIARIGSGSAPRSLYGGFVSLRYFDGDTRCEQLLSEQDWPLSVVVAVTTEAGKPVTSRDGMATSRDTSPYYASWIDSHPADMQAGLEYVAQRDFDGLAELAEHNCLKMHAVMMTTRPSLLYWSPVTVACMHAITGMRKDGVPVFFTIDAGPQVKAVCLPHAAEQVAERLANVPGVLRLIRGGLGGGPRIVHTDD